MKKYLLPIIMLHIFLSGFSQSYSVDFFVQKAKENSPLLHQQNSKSEIISLDLEQIKRVYTKPQIFIDANFSFSPIISTDNNTSRFIPIAENVADYYGYDLGVTDGGQYQAVVEINKPLFNSKKIEIFKQKADILQQENGNNIRLTTKELEYSVKHQYLLCLIAQKEIDFAEKNTNFLFQEIKTMEKLVENAIYRPTDLSLLKIEQRNYLIQSKKYRAIYRQRLANLLILCGIAGTVSEKLEDVNFELNSGGTDAIFIEKFTTDSLKIIANQQIDNVKYKPQLSVFANAGLNAIYLPDYKRFGLGFGLKFSWLLFDGKQANISKQKSEISLNNIAFEKQKVISDNELKRKNIIEQIDAVNEQIVLRNEQINAYNDLLKIYKIKISQGRMSIINFTEILKKIADTEKEKLLLEMQKQILINAYNFWIQ